MTVKFFEKSVWSIIAIGQAKYFAEWSQFMATGSESLDAWLFIAIIPIVMNAFMFFMFSRISRLRIPCLKIEYREQLDKKVEFEKKQSIAFDDEEIDPSNLNLHNHNMDDPRTHMLSAMPENINNNNNNNNSNNSNNNNNNDNINSNDNYNNDSMNQPNQQQTHIANNSIR